LSAALAPVWSRRWLGAVIVVVLAGTFGMILGLIMPRGPVTTAQAPTAMIASLLVGAAAGLLHRSRWSMLVAPAGAAPLAGVS
jgi:proline iminopeptidase